MTTKYDHAFSEIFEGIQRAEKAGHLTHDEAQELMQAVSDELDNIETREEMLYDVMPNLSGEVL
jgi:hypothetical protein